MPPTSNRRKRNVTAFVLLSIWLIAVITVVLWRRPEFWVEPNQRFERAEALAKEGRPREAIAAVDLALAKEPGNVGYLVFKGYRQLDLGDNAGAQQTFSRALAIDPSHAEARLGSASALAQLDKRDEALTTLQPLSPETVSSAQLHRRSQLYSTLDAPQSALAAYRAHSRALSTQLTLARGLTFASAD